MKKRNKVKNNFFIKFGLALFLFVSFMGVFFLVNNFIHETGHIFFSFLDGLIKGKVNHFNIGAWSYHPFFQFIPLPQQTEIISGTGSLNFALGGPIFSILSYLCLSIIGYFYSKDSKWFLLFISIFIFELSGNVVCGTDNFIQNPLSICNSKLDLFLQFISIFLFSGTFSYFTMKKLKYGRVLA